jgi:hypothetical protein
MLTQTAHIRTPVRARKPSGPAALRVALLAALCIAFAAFTPTAIARHARSSARHSAGPAGCATRHGVKPPRPGRRGRRCAPAPRSGRPASPGHPQIEASPLTLGPSVESAGAPATVGSPAPAAEPPADESAGGELLTNPIDPKYLTRVPFGHVSFWMQPWRAYLDTWPGSRLLDAVGINFNVRPEFAEAAAQLLQESGFKMARIPMNWDQLSYSDPTKWRPTAEPVIRARLAALHNHGLRPLIVLDAYSGAPTPLQSVTLETISAAPAGALSVTLSPASAAQVVPGKTGFNNLTFGGSPDLLITSVSPSGVASLSQPLRAELPAGQHRGTTLLYGPFTRPKLDNGQPNPAYEATLAGWLNYVGMVCKMASSVTGPGGFDLEIWNELTFESQFLNSEHYYAPDVENPEEELTEPEPPAEEPAKKLVSKEIRKALLNATVAFVRSPQSGASSEVGITNGFASQTPFPSGAAAPPGLTALSKHPYEGWKVYPEAYVHYALRPVNALGVGDTKPKEHMPYHPLFIPSYDSLFPEYTLNVTSTETLIRDLAPFTTYVYGFPHGREVGPPGGAPVQKWITEYNLSAPKELEPSLTAADKAHFHAKTLLRSLVAMVSKGVSREYFFAAAGSMGMIDEGFFSALEAHPGTYPGAAQGGEVMSGFRNMLDRFRGPGPEGSPQQLSLLSIAQEGNHAQFTGDGTAAHPSLYDREVLAAFPFQTSPTRYVIPVYVMTRDMLTLYDPAAPTSDIARYDLPDETFRITLGNLPETKSAPVVSAYDPLHNEDTPARLLTREGHTATFEINATDYPRLLTLDYAGS